MKDGLLPPRTGARQRGAESAVELYNRAVAHWSQFWPAAKLSSARIDFSLQLQSLLFSNLGTPTKARAELVKVLVAQKMFRSNSEDIAETDFSFPRQQAQCRKFLRPFFPNLERGLLDQDLSAQQTPAEETRRHFLPLRLGGSLLHGTAVSLDYDLDLVIDGTRSSSAGAKLHRGVWRWTHRRMQLLLIRGAQVRENGREGIFWQGKK